MQNFFYLPLTGWIIVNDDDEFVVVEWIFQLGHAHSDVAGRAPNHLRKVDGVFAPAGRREVVVGRFSVPPPHHLLDHRIAKTQEGREIETRLMTMDDLRKLALSVQCTRHLKGLKHNCPRVDGLTDRSTQ